MLDPEYALIKAIAGGDRSAFECMVKRYQNPICNFAYRYLGDRAAAEDITQEVLLRVYQAASRFDPRGRVSSWIFQIARNLSLNELKHRKRLRLDEVEMDNGNGRAPGLPANSGSLGYWPANASGTPSQVVDLGHEVMSALRALPENQRAALLLRVNEGLSYREIGEVLGVSVASVESLIFRARTHLRCSLRHK